MPWDGDKNDYLNRMRDGQLRIYSRPARPSACCEACTFLRGSHADWCPHYRTPGPVSDQQPAGAALRPESFIAAGGRS